MCIILITLEVIVQQQEANAIVGTELGVIGITISFIYYVVELILLATYVESVADEALVDAVPDPGTDTSNCTRLFTC